MDGGRCRLILVADRRNLRDSSGDALLVKVGKLGALVLSLVPCLYTSYHADLVLLLSGAIFVLRRQRPLQEAAFVGAGFFAGFALLPQSTFFSLPVVVLAIPTQAGEPCNGVSARTISGC